MTHLSPDVSTQDLLQSGLSREDRSTVGMFEELRTKRTTRRLSPDESSLLEDLTREVQSVHDRVMSATQN